MRGEGRGGFASQIPTGFTTGKKFVWTVFIVKVITDIRDNAKPLNAQLLKPTAMKYTFSDNSQIQSSGTYKKGCFAFPT